MSQAFDINKPILRGDCITDFPDVIETGRSKNLIALDTNDQCRVVVQERGDTFVGLEVPLV